MHREICVRFGWDLRVCVCVCTALLQSFVCECMLCGARLMHALMIEAFKTRGATTSASDFIHIRVACFFVSVRTLNLQHIHTPACKVCAACVRATNTSNYTAPHCTRCCNSAHQRTSRFIGKFHRHWRVSGGRGGCGGPLNTTPLNSNS